MNRDKITMLLLLVGTLIFFNSPAWHAIGSKIKPAPEKQELVDSTVSNDESAEPELLSSANTPQTDMALPGETAEIVQPEEISTESETSSNATEDSAETTIETVAAVPETTVIENNLLKLVIAGDGARIISAEVKGYSYAEKLNFGDQNVELIFNKDKGIAGSAINGKSLNSTLFTFVGEENGLYTFKGLFNGKSVEKRFSLQDSSYVVGYELSSELLTNANSTILFSSGITESESKDGMSLKYSPRLLSMFDGKKVLKAKFKGVEKKSESEQYDWIALTSRYFTIAALPSTVQNSNVDMVSRVIVPNEKAAVFNLIHGFSVTAPTPSQHANYSIYLGPNKIEELKKLQAGLDKTVFNGWPVLGARWWFPKLCELVLSTMNFFFMIFKDYGIAIILITILLRAITYPLTNSSMKSMAKMRDMQPKLQAIQAKYKNNPQLLQAKMMEFYKEEGVNPLSGLGGCLPMFLQMPIMISLFVVLRKAVQLRGQDTFLLPWVNDLSQRESLFDLPFSLFNIETIALLPFLMAGLMFWQNKMTMGKNSPATQSPEMVQQQRMMLYMMPIMMFFMFYNMPAGLTLYFTFSSVIQIVQQYLVDRSKKKSESTVTVVK